MDLHRPSSKDETLEVLGAQSATNRVKSQRRQERGEARREKVGFGERERTFYFSKAGENVDWLVSRSSENMRGYMFDRRLQPCRELVQGRQQLRGKAFNGATSEVSVFILWGRGKFPLFPLRSSG